MTQEQATAQLVSISFQLFTIGMVAGLVTRKVSVAPLPRTLMRMVIAGLFGLVFVWLGVLRQPVDLTMVIAVGTMLFGLVAGNLVGWLIGDWILARRR